LGGEGGKRIEKRPHTSKSLKGRSELKTLRKRREKVMKAIAFSAHSSSRGAGKEKIKPREGGSRILLLEERGSKSQG